MEYQVLARKWRPGKFCDMIGQEHIAKTIQNALLKNKLAHAYLFVGPRGIGKTTIARILAKAFNCKKAPAKEPCDECSSCKSINEGSNIDIIEIDGASNNGVDNVRNLREEALYAPANSKYKVYIIDEVHMLTNQAWNALLKLLEEPPAHVKFIFATTEAHKILPTVISRCQRYDLRKIPLNLIIQQLEKITTSEKVKISKEAIRSIAQAADGGMRDALSLTDQMIAFHSSEESEEIKESEILSIFGIVSTLQKEKIVKAILSNDYSTLFFEINTLAQQGKNLEHLFYDIVEYLRGVEITVLLKDPDEILEVGSDIIQIYKNLSHFTTLEKVQLILESLSTTGKLLHDAINKHVIIETALMKAMRFSSSTKLNDIINRLNQIKNNLPDSSSVSGNTSYIQNQPPEPLESTPSEPVYIPPKETVVKENPTEDAPPSVPEPQEPDPIVQNIPKPPTRAISPEKLWHKLIEAMDSPQINNPQLKFWMQEGKPVSFKDNTLTVNYDEEYNIIHAQRVREEKQIIIKNIEYMTGLDQVKLEIQMIKGLVSPLNSPKSKDIDEVREKIQNNQFVKSTIEIFDGNIVDFRG
ncbi:MAG TPA: DNA polymerase III subunit gamma/tau [Lentisphaeria bacterium]|nr:MAG: DNA polymerase III, subunit gamma and tau [Lentisphaerae bacterium GWF2_38_69]HBM16298.1 DNA polymerase III subunit gamma/tau [Lentisphaeria bacterium]